jgi:hypothetical protein
MKLMTAITVVGGVYRETNLQGSDDIFGSGGRGALALAAMGAKVDFHSYFDPMSLEVTEARFSSESISINKTMIPKGVSFYYTHWLDTPLIRQPNIKHTPLVIKADKVVRYGMIEGDAIVDADYAVYDPQNPSFPTPFEENGSKANHLAIVLNYYEAKALTGSSDSPEELAKLLVGQGKAEVVVIKLGAQGAIAYENGQVSHTPAFLTNHVWKIGSGDIFVAHFAYHWMHKRASAKDAIKFASLATAKYCESRNFPTTRLLEQFDPPKINLSSRYLQGYKPLIYLAGPFFSMAQLWLIDQARGNLRNMGMRVFSPFHDVGRGSADDVVKYDLKGIEDCDILLAIGDGLDSGTVYEIGYARAKNKPVVMYAENVSIEDKKMMEGSDCVLCNDYVSAIYKTIWKAIGT